MVPYSFGENNAVRNPASVSAGALNCEIRTGKKPEKYERRWYRRNMNLVNLRPKFNSVE